MLNPFNTNNRHGVDVSPSVVLFAVALIIGLIFIFFIRDILLLLFLAYVLAIALDPSVNKLQKKLRLPRPLSIFVVYVLLILAFVVITGIVVPPLVSQLSPLLSSVDLPFVQEKIMTFHFSITEVSELINQLGSSFNVVVDAIGKTFSNVLTLFTLLMMSYYILMEKPNLYKKITWFTNKPEKIDSFKHFLESLDTQLGGWVRGEFVLMAAIGFATYIGLLVFSVPYPLALALLAGLLEIVPSIGPTISAIPAIILAFATQGPIIGVAVLILYIVIQQVENSILVPQVMSKNANVGPLPAILSLMIGYKMFNVVGAIIAIPAYIVIRSFYSTWIRKRLE
ncbi:MAG: AI-2E family transporter [Patescibacteria group bacterium]